jgi:hypothetical protein
MLHNIRIWILQQLPRLSVDNDSEIISLVVFNFSGDLIQIVSCQLRSFFIEIDKLNILLGSL